MTQRIEPPATQPASFLALPVVSLAQAREALRPATAPQPRPQVRPMPTIGNVVLGAFMEALFQASPSFADTVLATIEEAAEDAAVAGADHAGVAFAAVDWLRDLRALVATEQGEA